MRSTPRVVMKDGQAHLSIAVEGPGVEHVRVIQAVAQYCGVRVTQLDFESAKSPLVYTEISAAPGMAVWLCGLFPRAPDPVADLAEVLARACGLVSVRIPMVGAAEMNRYADDLLAGAFSRMECGPEAGLPALRVCNAPRRRADSGGGVDERVPSPSDGGIITRLFPGDVDEAPQLEGAEDILKWCVSTALAELR